MSKKVSFSIEYNIQASPQLLFQYLSTPSGLSEWFADNVNSRGEIYTWTGPVLIAVNPFQRLPLYTNVSCIVLHAFAYFLLQIHVSINFWQQKTWRC